MKTNNWKQTVNFFILLREKNCSNKVSDKKVYFAVSTFCTKITSSSSRPVYYRFVFILYKDNTSGKLRKYYNDYKKINIVQYNKLLKVLVKF